MIQRALFAIALLVVPNATAAQNAEDLLREAQNAFQNLDFEQAATLYDLVLSGGAGATAAQRDTAQLYLGVSYEYAGQREDALTAFRGFVSTNACADAPRAFGASVTDAYNQARSSIVAVGLCDFDEQRLSLGDTLTFNVSVTRASLVSVVFQDSDGETVAQMVTELDEGTAQVQWAGALNPGLFSQRPSEYGLVLRARDQSGIASGIDSVPVQVFATAVDTVRHPIPLDDADLLPEERPVSAAYGDLGKGLSIGAGVAAASLLTYSSLKGEFAKAVAVGGSISLAGIVALLRGSSDRTIPANQLHNETLRAEWTSRRDSVVSLNRTRLEARELVISRTGESR